MKQIIEYLPIIIFTITYFYTRDIFFATLILLISLFSQVCLEYLLEKKVSKKTKIIFGISLLFGGSTIFFRNEEFLFWRPTVINWIFSVLLLSFEVFSGKNLLKFIMGKYSIICFISKLSQLRMKHTTVVAQRILRCEVELIECTF